ncbi:MAG: EAL domain-containing protein [Spirochaetota bacterium]|nr:EAL domain-containing protein [Spirochaetota bacterium]
MNILLGRQSILDRNQNVIAYELLFRSTDNSPINSDTEATANVITTTLSIMSIDNILGQKKGFINIGIDILRKGLLDIIPPNRFVIEILETQDPSEELLSLIKKFKKKDYIFALDDFIINEEQIEHWRPILNEVSIVKVDVLDTNLEDLEKKTALLKPFNIILLAEKVETEEMFQLCNSLGYQYFQGFFFTKPVILESHNIAPSIQGVFAVIKLLQQDADILEIEQTMKLYPKLIISLLKVVNSASVATIQEITSIKQAIALLGKKAFTQWLLLLLYSQKSQTDPNQKIKDDPLFLLATQRGKLMEYFLTQSTPNASKSLKDEAFLVGLLSLSDTLLHVPMDHILQQLHLSPTISKAIITHEGSLGEFLQSIKHLETQDYAQLIPQINKLNISTDMLNEASLLTLKFAQELANQL